MDVLDELLDEVVLHDLEVEQDLVVGLAGALGHDAPDARQVLGPQQLDVVGQPHAVLHRVGGDDVGRADAALGDGAGLAGLEPVLGQVRLQLGLVEHLHRGGRGQWSGFRRFEGEGGEPHGEQVAVQVLQVLVAAGPDVGLDDRQAQLLVLDESVAHVLQRARRKRLLEQLVVPVLPHLLEDGQVVLLLGGQCAGGLAGFYREGFGRG